MLWASLNGQFFCLIRKWNLDSWAVCVRACVRACVEDTEDNGPGNRKGNRETWGEYSTVQQKFL